MYNARPNADCKALLVAVMSVFFKPNMTVWGVENPSFVKNSIYTSPVDSEENKAASSNHQAGMWHF
jgi:hypothetical protein